MYELVPTKTFRKNLKHYSHNKRKLSNLRKVLSHLQKGIPLSAKYEDHNLKGRRSNYRECHIEPDFLLVYYVAQSEAKIYLQDLGSHSEIFG